MAGHYRRRSAASKRGNSLGYVLLSLFFFIAGYCSASIYPWSELSAWLGAHLLAKTTSQMIVRTGSETAPLPKPKFEFYTVLTKDQSVARTTPTSAPPSSTAKPPIVEPVSTTALQKALPLHAPLAPDVSDVASNTLASSLNQNDQYVIQVGSFKNAQEAERMKAALVMKGFDVHFSTVAQQGVTWYRVMVGPFASKTKAQETLLGFARREHITGMIRRMDA